MFIYFCNILFSNNSYRCLFKPDLKLMCQSHKHFVFQGKSSMNLENKLIQV